MPPPNRQSAQAPEHYQLATVAAEQHLAGIKSTVADKSFIARGDQSVTAAVPQQATHFRLSQHGQVAARDLGQNLPSRLGQQLSSSDKSFTTAPPGKSYLVTPC